MRAFNLKEKEILRMLCDYNFNDLVTLSFFLQTRYFQKYSSQALFLFTKEEKALLFLKQDVYNDLERRKKEIGSFMELFFLINYLKNNRLINILPNPEVENYALYIMKEGFEPQLIDKTIYFNNKEFYLFHSELAIYDCKSNKKEYSAIELNKELFDVIKSDWMSFLFITEDLKDFVKNNFKTKEDRRHKVNLFATWISIFLAFIFGLYGICKDQTNKSTKIDKEQFETIKSKITDLNKTLSKKDQ